MLRTRVMTALALLALLLAVLFSHSFLIFALMAAVFFAAAAWENLRLFQVKLAMFGAAAWILAYWYFISSPAFLPYQKIWMFGFCVAIWVVMLVPSLAIGLPSLTAAGSQVRTQVRIHLINAVYGFSILGCFIAIAELFKHSPLYLFSVMSIVWIADIGAYFSGKAFGKRKLASSISPGKSWEGAIGGWLAVLVCTALTIFVPALADTFAVKLQAAWGWLGFAAVMSLIAAASVVGDLFESLLKRRAGMKDSSNLLPGHGGVLDRIDALIPVLPLAVLLDFLF